MTTGDIKELGRYRFIRKLGSGGMAEVYLARSYNAQGIEKLLVVKRILPALARNHRFITMFIDEAKVAMRLNHPNIVQVYSFESMEGNYLLAMEFVDGFDVVHLQGHLRSQGKSLPLGLAAFIVREVSKGLDYAHDRRDEHGLPLDIVHRDVSPQNVLISRDGAVKIADFGIAKARLVTQDAEGTIKGKVNYMSPEQATGRPVDRRSDIFSLGVVLHELITGTPLFYGKPPAHVLEMLRKGEIAPPETPDPTIPAELQEIVRRCLKPESVDRFQSAREMIVELGRFLHRQEEYFDASALARYIGDHLAQDPTFLPPLAEAIPMPATAASKPSRPLGTVEQRDVVVLSGRFLPRDPQAEWVGRYRKRLDGIVEQMAFKAEGILERQGENDFLITLGLPISSVDDAIHGVRLCLDLIEASAGLGRDVGHAEPSLSIGIARGRTLCRLEQVGMFVECDPASSPSDAAMALSLIARPGEILAGGGIYRLARKEFDFQSETGKVVDIPAGKSTKRLTTYQVIGVKSREKRLGEIAGASELFYGRELELWSMERAFRQAMMEQRLRVTVVSGEMGVGKTSLVRRFLESRDPELCRILPIECLYAERAQPYASVSAVVHALFDLTPGLDLDEASDRLGRSVSKLLPRCPRLAARISEALVEMISPSVQRTEEKRLRHLKALGQIVNYVAKTQRLLVVFDNAQWMDPASADLLLEQARISSSLETPLPIHAIVAARPELGLEVILPNMEKLELFDLRESVRRKMVRDRLIEGATAEDMAEDILSKTGGNPLFINEVFETLVEKGILKRAPDGVRFTVVQKGPVDLPTTLEGLVASRLDALSTLDRLVLRIASAAGADFTEHQLSELAGMDVHQALQQLVERKVLSRRPVPDHSSGNGRAVRYQFAQSVVREVAYRSLPQTDRQRVHRWMAEHLAAGMAERGDAAAALIAWHMEHAGDEEQAGAMYLKAAEAARMVNSTREARLLYDKAITLMPRYGEDSFLALSQREQLLRVLGRDEERQEDIASLIAAATHHGAPAKLALAWNRQGRRSIDHGKYTEAREHLERAIQAAGEGKDASGKVEALRLLAIVEVEEGHLARAVDHCEAALRIFEPSALTSEERATVLNSKGIVLMNVGQLRPAMHALVESMVIFRHRGIKRMESVALTNMSVLAHHFGEYEDGLNVLQTAMEIDASLHNRYARSRKKAALAAILAEVGDFPAAADQLAEAETQSIEAGDGPGLVEALLAQADMLLQAGDPAGAAPVLDRILDRERENTSRLSSLALSRLVSDRYRVVDDVPKALEEAQRMKAAAFAMGAMAEEVHALARVACLLAQSGDTGEAMAVSDRALNRLEILKVLRRSDEVFWLIAQAMASAGNSDRAAILAHRAMEDASEKRSKIKRSDLRKAYENHPRIRAIVQFSRGLGRGI